jgi:hypothetical protein
MGRVLRSNHQIKGSVEQRGRTSSRRQELQEYHAHHESVASPPRTFLQYLFGIGEEHLATSTPASKLIYPLSLFAVSWVIITAVFLAYTAIVTPPIIVFYWLDPECTVMPTLPVDTMIDTFFLLDIILNFNTGVLIAGEYIDDRWRVAKIYFRGMFFFDLLTRSVRSTDHCSPSWSAPVD